MNRTQTTALLLSIAVTSALQAQARGTGRQAPATSRPKAPLAAAWYDAGKAASQHKAPILAFVLPAVGNAAAEGARAATRAAEASALMLVTMGGAAAPKMKTARDVMLRQVQLLRGAQNPTLAELPKATDAQLVFALTVVAVAEPSSCHAKPGENVVLLSPQGKRIAGWQLDLLDASGFVKAIGKHVFSEQSLAPRQANLAPKPKQLLDDVRKRIAAKGKNGIAPYFAQLEYQKLGPHLVALGPALVRRQNGKVVAEPELWGAEGGRAPYGTTAKVELGDPCPGCGMGYTPPGLMTVLKLVGP